MAKKKYRVQGISFPDEELYQAALKKAQDQRRSLSNYICGLLEEDLHNAVELKEAPAPASSATEAGKAAAEQMISAAESVSYSGKKPVAKKGPQPKTHLTAKAVLPSAKPGAD